VHSRLADRGGLHLELTPNVSRRWFGKYRFVGEETRLALGQYAEAGSKKISVSLKHAREAIVRRKSHPPVQGLAGRAPDVTRMKCRPGAMHTCRVKTITVRAARPIEWLHAAGMAHLRSGSR